MKSEVGAPTPSLRVRILIALGTATLAGALAYTFRFVFGQQTSDFDQILVGLHRALNGSSPYTIRPLPGLQWPIYYPMPALLLGLPFIGLSSGWAQVLFCMFSGLAFGWGVSADGDAKLFGVATWSFVLCISLGQWTIALMAAATVPWLGWLVIAKPNLGLAIGLAYADRWVRRPVLWINTGIAAALVAVSFAVRPTWLPEWLTVVRQPTPHIIMPVAALGGPLLLLGLWKWREREARLIAGLACVPQTFSSYDSLLLFLIVRTRREALILVAASAILTGVVGWIGPATTYAETVRRFAPWRIFLLYLPALLVVMARAARTSKARVGASANDTDETGTAVVSP